MSKSFKDKYKNEPKRIKKIDSSDKKVKTKYKGVASTEEIIEEFVSMLDEEYDILNEYDLDQ